MKEEQGVERLNLLSVNDATAEFLNCCGSKTWVRQMIATRPFKGPDELIECADRIWWLLEPPDWLEAFRSHPKIGEKKAEQATSAEARKWSEQEQAGTLAAAHETMQALADGNRAYEHKFGHIFIVCATGKTSVEMLALLRARLENDPETELRVAAEEQRKITHLRLRKLIALEDQ